MTQGQTTVLVQGVIRRPDGSAFCREGIDRPILLVPYSFLAVVQCVEESLIVHVKLAGADTDDWSCYTSW